jgi:hypothetical protein
MWSNLRWVLTGRVISKLGNGKESIMSGDVNTSFSAALSAVGYLYQSRYALMESLRRLRRNSDFTVSLETLDDVVFEAAGEPLDLIQTKHHMNRSANLTDASPDLWKSLRIWCERLTERQVPRTAPSTSFRHQQPRMVRPHTTSRPRTVPVIPSMLWTA